jgi:phosphoenolpyruvate carboxykinase (ATP)
MSLPHTRAMVRAAIEGRLDDVRTVQHPVFGLAVPLSCPGVPDAVLDARGQWAHPDAYDRAARQLAELFRKNYQKFESGVEEASLVAPAG